MKSLTELGIKLSADGADRAGMCKLYECKRSTTPPRKGFTTNPTLMHKVGVCDYRQFARQVLDAIPDRPISFEVFADEMDEIGGPAQGDRLLGRERRRQGSRHQHPARVLRSPDTPPHLPGRARQRHRDDYLRADAAGPSGYVPRRLWGAGCGQHEPPLGPARIAADIAVAAVIGAYLLLPTCLARSDSTIAVA